MKKPVRWKVAQFAEIRWWKKYLGPKDLSAYLSWKKNYWIELLEQILPHLKLEAGERVLDAGCGPAGINMVLTNHSVDAIDPLLDSYKEKLQMPKESAFPHVNFKNIALENVEEKDTYQAVFCLNVINHVANIKASLLNIIRAIKPGGSLVLTVDAHNWQLFRILFGLIPGDILHPHQYKLDEYKQLVENRGCVITYTKLVKREFIFSYYLLIAERKPKNKAGEISHALSNSTQEPVQEI